MILLDFDGVLADSIQFSVNAANAAFEALDLEARSSRETIANLASMTFQGLAATLEVPEEFHDRAAELAFEHLKGRDEIPAIYEGLAEQLQALSNEHQLGVLSSNIQHEIERFLEAHRIDSLFHTVIGLASKRAKVDVLKELKLSEHPPICYVGDAISDIRAAQGAEIPSVAVGWGYQGKELLMSAEPDLFLAQVSSLPEISRQFAP